MKEKSIGTKKTENYVLIFLLCTLALFFVFSTTEKVIAEKYQNNSTIGDNNLTSCGQAWNCTNWSSCINGEKTRICSNQLNNSCLGKPFEMQYCSNNQTNGDGNQTNGNGNGTSILTNPIFWLALVIAIIIIILIIILSLREK